MDLIPLIRSFELEEEERQLCIHTIVSAQNPGLNPALLAVAAKKNCRSTFQIFHWYGEQMFWMLRESRFAEILKTVCFVKKMKIMLALGASL